MLPSSKHARIFSSMPKTDGIAISSKVYMFDHLAAQGDESVLIINSL
jgi:hypothetical protein